MNAIYNEESALAEYITTNFSNLMTDFESKVYRLAMQRAKAEGEGPAAYRLPKWIKDAGPQVAVASEVGFAVVSKQITDRILREIDNGQIVINRCPACCKIVRTPLARQCLWCGFDWHERNAS